MFIQSVHFFELLSVADYIVLISVIALTVVNAIVSGAAIAYFSLSEEQINQLRDGGNRVAERVSKLLDVTDRLSGTIFFAYNFFNITIAGLSFYLLTNKVDAFMGKRGVWLALLVIIAYIFFFIEILPKSYATQRPVRFARFSSRMMSIVVWLFAPFSVLLAKTTTIFKTDVMEKRYDLSLDDISTALELSAEVVHEKEKDMLEGIIKFRDKVVEDIFIARGDMVALDIEITFSEVISSIIAAGFSRIPVYHDNIDNIKGVLYVKDLLPHIEKSDNFRWQSLIRPAYFVPGAKRIDDLLEEFRANKNHMAIVVDEYGGTSGIVTLEDILEEIVGDISDEYDEDEVPAFVRGVDGSYIFEGRTSLEHFVEIIGVSEKEFEEIGEGVDTLAGLLLELKGDFPKLREVINYRGYHFEVDQLDDRRIIKIKYLPNDTGKGTGDLEVKMEE